MQIDGRPIKASRLFLGNEYKLQITKLLDYFQKRPKYHHRIEMNWKLMRSLQENFQRKFVFETFGMQRKVDGNSFLETFRNFEEAYHQLMLELVELQIRSSEMAIGKSSLQKIYIDGGFTDNDIYVKLLDQHFSDHKIYTARSALGSALGAAIVISTQKINKRSLAKHYKLSRHKSLKKLMKS
jgi:sugar (pentulose or hexulose) kinase